MLLSTKHLLKYQVKASDGAEALSLVRTCQPDLVLLDIRLSDDPRDRGGIEALRRIRATGNPVPAVMITSLTEVSEIRDAMRSGAQDYVFKDELSPEMLVIADAAKPVAVAGIMGGIESEINDKTSNILLEESQGAADRSPRRMKRIGPDQTKTGVEADLFSDRPVYDDRGIDAVFVAAPNHWHALAACHLPFQVDCNLSLPGRSASIVGFQGSTHVLR